jgi:PAS domain S-box-containing protein
MTSTRELVACGLDQLSIGFGIFDSDRLLVSCNLPFQTLRDYPDDLCVPGTSLETLIEFNAKRGDFGPGDAHKQTLERLKEIDQTDEREIEREMSNGQILSIRYRHLENGGLTIILEDKTQTRRAEKALAMSEERYALISEAAEEAIYEWDIKDDRFYASSQISEFMGKKMDPEGKRESNWESHIHPDDLDYYTETLAAHRSGEVPKWQCEYRFRNGSGDYRWVLDHGTSIRDDCGQAIRMVAAIKDITERVEREKALAASEERHQLVTKASSHGVYDWDVADDSLYVSEKLKQIFGFGTEMLQSQTWANAVHREDVKRYLNILRDHFKGETEDVECEYRIVCPDGVYRWVRDHGIGVRGEDGRVTRLVGAVRDITDVKAAEEELDHAEKRLRGSLETISDGYLLVDAQDRVQLWNKRYLEIFGNATGSDIQDIVVKGKPFIDMIYDGYERGMFKKHPKGVEGWIAERRKTRVNAASQLEMELSNNRWLLINERRMSDGGRVSVYNDITEFKRREEDLKTQSAILEATLENMGQGISMVDNELNVVMFNKKFLEYFDFPERDFQRGFHMSQAFRLNAERGEYGDGDVEEQIAERLELSAKFLPHRFERARPDGPTLEIVGNPVDDSGFVTTYTDVTKRTKADQELRERETELSTALQEFNAVLDTIEYGVLFMGADHRGRIINRAFANLWGISQEFVDRNPTMRELIEYNKETGLYDVAPEDWDAWVEERIQAVENGDFGPIETQRADGKVLQHQCIALPDGGRMLTYFDITELKRREADLTATKNAAERALQDLQQAQDRLIQAEKMASLGQLTAGIAHEIKNPLNFVNNFSNLSVELLEELAEVLREPIASLNADERDDAEDLLLTVKGNLGKINEHGQRADAIVKNMLLHSRDGPGEMQSSDLNAIAEEALNLAYHGARAENSKFNVEMTKTLSDDVGQIECFPQDLMRVFLNLISNGMYAATAHISDLGEEAEARDPKINVETREDGAHVIVEIRDNGAGIPPELQEQIFTPFFTTKPAGEGTGLGLSLSYDIVVKQHGGSISVESEPGEFTEFKVVLPRVFATAPAPGDQP